MKVTVAAIQMNSNDDVADNLQRARKWVLEAAQKGAQFVVLPEYFCFIGQNDAARLAHAEPDSGGVISQALRAIAKEAQVWLSAGTIPLISPDKDKVYNTNLLFNPEGECVGRYDKIHLFGFDNGQESYKESDTLYPGKVVTTFELPFAKVRPSVCYDLRFPELYRLHKEYEVITVPAAFTYTTGQAHWELLLRARAVENQCVVIAAAQTGVHPNGNRTFGHSMIIGPWGEVLAMLEEGEGVVTAEIDLERLDQSRQQLPALKNRIFY